jgi:hypothetical protein
MTARSLLPLRQAAQRIHLAPERTLRLVVAGKLTGELIGARWYVGVPSIERFERERLVSLHVGPSVVAGGLR